MEYYLKAAEKGNDNALFNIGLLYDNGERVEQDYSKAMEYYLKAAEKGNVDAFYNIGYLYENGYGVEQDHLKAIEYLALLNLI